MSWLLAEVEKLNLNLSVAILNKNPTFTQILSLGTHLEKHSKGLFANNQTSIAHDTVLGRPVQYIIHCSISVHPARSTPAKSAALADHAYGFLMLLYYILYKLMIYKWLMGRIKICSKVAGHDITSLL
ncbi:MAG: hypothetical protein V3R51_01705, partial [Gammaproteobacteria bacterium]